MHSETKTKFLDRTPNCTEKENNSQIVKGKTNL